MSVGACRLATSGRLLARAYSSYPAVLKGNTVRIGCSSGFWGDTSVAGGERQLEMTIYINIDCMMH